ncbi:MAG: DNA polymerase III subunit gamma/tau [Candidatus Dormibacteraeota bacterium]|nr:DNA polymerase III subunit gamma/tau [Candidatus Dormibacteraeota bacterium]
MSVALYRRYRPERFGDLIGQDVVARTLLNEVRAGTLAHAYLFAGTRGTGKTSTARILARAVNCLAPEDGEPCNSCAACIEILSGASVDVLEIDAASNRGIDEMRDLRDKVKYLPASLRRKAYIIDEAHMLTPEAWNAFLKTLEEPPGHVFFVLATTEPHKVPDTVRSRVQRFDFRRIRTDAIARHLATVAGREDLKVDAEALQLIARAAQGSVRDALSLLDQAASGGDSPLTLVAARRALGLTDPGLLHELMRTLAGADAAGVLRTAARAFEAGADPRQLLRDVSRLARAAELAALGYAEGAEVSPEEAALAADVAAVAPQGFWLTALDLFAAAEMNLRQPVDARLQVELCLLRLVRPPAAAAPEDAVAALEARVAALERGAVSTPPGAAQAGTPANATPVPQATPSAESGNGAQAAPPPAPAAAVHGLDTVERWRDEWPMLIEAVTRSDTMLAGVLRDCRPLEASPGKLVIGAKGGFHFERISDPHKAAVLATAAASVAGHDVSVESRFIGEPRPEQEAPAGTLSDVTQAVLQTFAGSRVTGTRAREEGSGPAPGARRDA